MGMNRERTNQGVTCFFTLLVDGLDLSVYFRGYSFSEFVLSLLSYFNG